MAKLAIYFPGIGYTVDKPLLYYGKSAVREAGYVNERNVSYSYAVKDNLRGNSEKIKETYEALLSQADNQLKDVDFTLYDDVLFVSKSIGTIVACAYAEKYRLTQVRHVLYTPLEQTFDFTPHKAVGFIGTADPWSNVEEIIKLSQNAGISMNIYDNCTHSLECKDTLRNIGILKDIMQKTLDFCRRTE